MNKLIIIFVIVLLSVSCKKSVNTLEINFSRSDSFTNTSLTVFDLRLESTDSVFYANNFYLINSKGKLRFDSLPNGYYDLKYMDILGNKNKKRLQLKGNDSIVISIITDTIDIDKYIVKAPINNITEEGFYIVETKGGCIATMHSFYKISKDQGRIYFESVNTPKRILTVPEMEAVKKFEAELLAINGVDICMSTGRMTYKILKDKDTITIVDNTCNWVGWETMMAKITDVK